MEIVYNQKDLENYLVDAVEASEESPVLLDSFLNHHNCKTQEVANLPYFFLIHSYKIQSCLLRSGAELRSSLLLFQIGNLPFPLHPHVH